jgi:3,4-dihydroxy 2-butanone 4-phosphate synthase
LTVTEAISALRSGNFVLVHDEKNRENEVDMVIAAEMIRPEHVAIMRRDAGGLLCLAISHDVATKLGLGYMHDMISSMGKINPLFSKITRGKTPYGDRPSFSISINHRNTFTGITDNDRALTISKMAKVCKEIDSGGVQEFASDFFAPGHVPLLIGSKNLLLDRMGHTELCIYLMQLAGLTPAVAICEMMDSNTHKALTLDAAKIYAKRLTIPVVDAEELKAHAKAA